MTFDAWPLLFGIAFHALLFHAMPRFSRPGILFAVTVPDSFVSGAGRTLVSRYRAIVWTSAVLATALAVFPISLPGSGRPGSLYAVAGNLIADISAWFWAHRRAHAHAVRQPEMRVASLVPRDTSLPGGALFAGGPFVILLIAGVLVVTRWDQVPESARTIRSLGPLAFGALYAGIMLTFAVSLSRGTRQIAVEGMAAALEQRFRRLNVLVIVLVAYGVAMQMSAVMLQSIPAFSATSPKLGVLLLPLMLFNFGVAFWMFRVGQGGQRAVPEGARQDTRGDATPDDAWKIGGMFYFNRKDPAVWVDNRFGVGYTLNMGNANAWLLIGLLLLPMIAARLLFS